MSHPKRKDLFDAWYKAMVAGATVDKPNYGKVSKDSTTPRKRTNSKRRRRKRRRKKNNDA